MSEQTEVSFALEINTVAVGGNILYSVGTLIVTGLLMVELLLWCGMDVRVWRTSN